MTVVKNSAGRLTRLNDDIQTIGLIDAERITLSPEPIDIAEIFEEARHSLQDAIERKRLTISADVAADAPKIDADRWHVAQVVLRLLSNAVSYSYSGGHIALRASLNDDHLLQVDVADNGVGIAPEQQRQLFRRFDRADNPRRGQVDGAGLGLAIARSFVELHGGELWVRSEVGQGSTFSFTLPAIRPAHSEGQ